MEKIKLPHGKIPIDNVPEHLASIIIKLNENIDKLKSEIEKLRKELIYGI